MSEFLRGSRIKIVKPRTNNSSSTHAARRANDVDKLRQAVARGVLCTTRDTRRPRRFSVLSFSPGLGRRGASA